MISQGSFLCLSDWTYIIGRRSGTGHPSDVSGRDLTHKYERDSLSERRHVLVSWQTVCSVYWTKVSDQGGSRSSTSVCDSLCSHFIDCECVFLLFLPVRSSGKRVCGTSSSVFLLSSLWFRFWCCLFFRTLPDIYSLRKATKRPARKVGWDSRYCVVASVQTLGECSPKAALLSKSPVPAEAEVQRTDSLHNFEAELKAGHFSKKYVSYSWHGWDEFKQGKPFFSQLKSFLPLQRQCSYAPTGQVWNCTCL